MKMKKVDFSDKMVNQEGNIMCPDCERTYKRYSDFKKHAKKFHPNMIINRKPR